MFSAMVRYLFNRIQFWTLVRPLQDILGDRGHVLFRSLPPSEVESVMRAGFYLLHSYFLLSWLTSSCCWKLLNCMVLPPLCFHVGKVLSWCLVSFFIHDIWHSLKKFNRCRIRADNYYLLWYNVLQVPFGFRPVAIRPSLRSGLHLATLSFKPD